MNSAAKQPAENKMGVMPVNKLLLTMSLPMMLSMLVQALYNIVDSIWVARLSEEALTAVSLAFPAQNLMIGVGVGTGVGVNALLSKSLGEKNFDTANKTAVNSLFLALMSYAVFAVLGLTLARRFFLIQTDIAEIVEGGTIYLTICTVFSFGIFLQIAFERLLTSAGRTMGAMVSQLVGAIINIILDPIMIFGLLGFPAMGIAGAAAATVIGQICGMLVGLLLNITRNKDIQLHFRGYRPDRSVIGRIYVVGIPSIIMTSMGSVMTFGFNKILLAFTATATAVFGVYFKLQSFVFMPVFGLNNGMVPILSYNYGARQPARIKQTLLFSMLYASIVMLLGVAVFWLFTPQLLGLFQASQTMLEIGISALRIICLHFIFAGFCICMLSMCQALGHGFMSLTVSVVRQIVVLLPAAYLLSHNLGLGAVWWSFPIAEVSAVILCVLYMRRIYNREIKPLEEAAARMSPSDQTAPHAS